MHVNFIFWRVKNRYDSTIIAKLGSGFRRKDTLGNIRVGIDVEIPNKRPGTPGSAAGAVQMVESSNNRARKFDHSVAREWPSGCWAM
jgi:hypothetical protein